MKWLKNLLNKLFNKNKQKLLESPAILESPKIQENNFIFELQRQANPEADLGNGYKIAPQYRLEDGI